LAASATIRRWGALIGRQVEEEVEVTVPSGDKYYLVEKIEFI
jgi:transcription elongation factor GreA